MKTGDQVDMFPDRKEDPRRNLEEARRRRENALARVASQAFTASVRAVVGAVWNVGDRISGEDIRLGCNSEGVYARDPHAWGGVTMALHRAGVLEKTEQRVTCEDPNTHARDTPIWVVL